MMAREKDSQFRVIETVKTMADDCTGHAISVALTHVTQKATDGRKITYVEDAGVPTSTLQNSGRGFEGAAGPIPESAASPPSVRLTSRTGIRRRTTLKGIGEALELKGEELIDAVEFRRLSQGIVNDDAMICQPTEYSREDYPADAPCVLDRDLPPRGQRKPSKASRMRAAMDSAAHGYDADPGGKEADLGEKAFSGIERKHVGADANGIEGKMNAVHLSPR